MPVGFSKACRTCLTLDGTLISIYDSISYDGRGRVTEMIKDITKIKVSKEIQKKYVPILIKKKRKQ